MTIRQEAIQLINKMPDERVRVIIELLHYMEPNTYVEEQDDRMAALRWMQKRHANMDEDMYADLDFDKEREEAYTAKYGDLG